MANRTRRYSWTQPCCTECWNQKNPEREPVRVLTGGAEVCCYCGVTTYSGIYLRIDPTTVDYPSLHKS